MQLVGRRTYAVCLVIIALAACQRFLGLAVPQEVWIVLFGLVGITMRAAVSNAASSLFLLLLPCLILSGCVATGGRFVKQCVAPTNSITSIQSPKSDLVFMRFAFAYPFKLGNISYEDKYGDSFSITGYETDGGQKDIEALSAVVVKALDAYLFSQTGAGLSATLLQAAASKASSASK